MRRLLRDVEETCISNESWSLSPRGRG